METMTLRREGLNRSFVRVFLRMMNGILYYKINQTGCIYRPTICRHPSELDKKVLKRGPNWGSLKVKPGNFSIRVYPSHFLNMKP